MAEKKRRGWFRWWYIPLAIVVVIVIIAVASRGGGTPTAQAPGQTTAPQAEATAPGLPKVGDRVEAGGVALTVMGVTTVNSISDFLKPKEGNVYLVVDVLIETTGRDSAPYNPLYFKVKDDGGIESNASLVGPDPSLKSGDLVKGDKVRGNVAFEVGASASGFVLTYEPMVIAGGYEAIRVDLGK